MSSRPSRRIDAQRHELQHGVGRQHQVQQQIDAGGDEHQIKKPWRTWRLGAILPIGDALMSAGHDAANGAQKEPEKLRGLHLHAPRNVGADRM